ncbi:hypothetical protein Asppvi_003968 [Aspergillus pseudoviridinutans]|uniref:Uncharacterized protein n=1 Tax=Aspergillus pseudoviridinutans TaxID=1517512 RepID=A0A9P3B5P3_9EURO|nr:uncharacterized protein Asppvi_003968 [Aspergillus pseudoviridinutans]GIJ85112.1 hypothetical protein Asppvi_003968 [Aspergillus pseudoviridinutans]
MSTEYRPEILLLSLDYLDFLDDTYSSLFNSLVKSALVKRVKTANAALRYLDDNNPKAIIVTDQGLTDWRHHEVLRKVQTYIRYGGLAIIGLHFPSFVTMDVFDAFFAFGFGLPWKHSDYTRKTSRSIHPASCHQGVKSSSLPAQPYTKVLHVKGARLHERILVPVTYHETKSLSSSQGIYEEESEDGILAAVAGAQLGSGCKSEHCHNEQHGEDLFMIRQIKSGSVLANGVGIGDTFTTNGNPHPSSAPGVNAAKYYEQTCPMPFESTRI